jgi:hypothetical protein
VLYATSGHLLIQSLLGTNQLWISALLGASVLLLVTRRELGSGLAQALAICTTKFLAALFWPVLWISSARRARWAGAALVASAAVYAAFALAGADLVYPLRHEDGLTSPGNLPYLLEPLLSAIGIRNPHVLDGAAFTTLSAATTWLYWRARVLAPESRRLVSLAGIALIGLVFMLVSKKSATGYAVFFMYPAMVVLVLAEPHARVRAGFALLFNVLLATQPSLLFHLGGHAPSGHGPSLSEWLHASSLRAGGFALLNVVLVACYGYLAVLSVLCVRRVVKAAMSSRSAQESAAVACSPV